MSADASLNVAPPAADLPRRTWRQWWRQLPAWKRMLIWGVAAIALLHAALFIRLMIGQVEPAEIQALRRRNIFFQYAWDKHPERFPFEHWLLAGMAGKNCDSVIDLRLGADATDTDLELIGKYFHHLKHLTLKNSGVSSEAMAAIRNCPNLEWLDLSNTAANSEALEAIAGFPNLYCVVLCETDIDDSGIAHLATLRKLRALDLRGTRVTNAAIPILERLPTLQSVFVTNTGITESADGDPLPKWVQGARRN